jgi:hypothetical protein
MSREDPDFIDKEIKQAQQEYFLGKLYKLGKYRSPRMKMKADPGTLVLYVETCGRWHKCLELCQIYRKYDFCYFTIGQSQKWVNMSLKSMGEDRIPGCQEKYQYIHIPLDTKQATGGDGIVMTSFRNDGSIASKYSEKALFLKKTTITDKI